MAVERTLSIIKPDAVAKNVIGKIYSRFETAGLEIVAARMTQLSRAEAEGFYAVHRERPFFKDLVDFMISGPGDDPGARGRERDREEPRPDGRHRSEEGRRRARSAPTSPSRSTPTRCTAPTARRPRRSRSRTSSRRSTIYSPLTVTPGRRTHRPMINLLDLDADGLARFFAELGEKPFRARQVSALGAPALRRPTSTR